MNLLIKKNISKNGKELGFIINADSILPSDLIKYFDLSNTIVYYFVSQKLSPQEILYRCRNFDTKEEWTTRITNEQLLKHFTFYKGIEKTIIEDCNKYNFKCIDTSENRKQIFNNLIEELQKELI